MPRATFACLRNWPFATASLGSPIATSSSSNSSSAWRRYGAPFGVVLLDLDHFKAVKDRYGHPAGDQVLQAVASSLRSSVREADLPGRWGGEESLVIATFADRAGLAALAGRVCRRIEATTAVVGRARPRTTCSIGATACCETDDRHSLAGRADRLLYESRTRGRNCVTYG